MAVDLTDITTVKRVVACGNDEVWYEDSDMAGTMIELTAANGDVDTTDMLSMFAMYQKAFILNGSNLKVADFINTKLTHSALDTAHAKGDILTQVTSNAVMVVDFTDSAKTHTYGYVTSGTFDATNQVTGNGSGSAFNPSAVTVKPHWYDWTVYPGGSSGSLPNKAYLGCNYRGRAVIAGNPESPFQWYMSRYNNPWDFNWAVSSSDSLRPMQGGLGNAGELGDIIRALIPCGDDYLLFGCASSFSIMFGDPAAGGSINLLDRNTGIFGATSWCFIGKNTLAFWGINGLYIGEIPNDFECKNAISLPDLVGDEGASPTTHRISMVFDVKRQGILICITKIVDGSNSNYFYDLKTEGFFPEEYPDECGAYSLINYQANDPAFSGALMGCKDGYIRKFDESAKDDDIGPSDQTINSYVSLGPIQLSGDNEDISLSDVQIITGGGNANGTHVDSNDLEYKIFVGNTAEETMEKLDADSIPALAGVANNSGKKSNVDKRRIRGTYSIVKIGNNTASQTWSFEKLIIGRGE